MAGQRQTIPQIFLMYFFLKYLKAVLQTDRRMTSSTIGSSQSAKYCVWFRLSERKKNVIPRNEYNILMRELWHWNDTIQHTATFFEFVAQIGREMTERKSLLIRKL